MMQPSSEAVSQSTRVAVTTDKAPAPAGTYSQAIVSGGFIFISGQTPRHPDGERALTAPFDEQAELVMKNLDAVATAAGASMADAVQVTVYLRDPANSAAFDAVYARWVGTPPPSRTLVQSSLTIGELEVNAVLAAP